MSRPSCKRILVSPADTPLGAALVRALLAHPEVERVIALSSPEASPVLDSDPRLRLARVDFRHDRELWRLLFGEVRDEHIDCVVHDPIGLKASHRPQLSWAKTVAATHRLAQHCASHPSIARHVLRSSVEVYRVAADQPVMLEESHALDLWTPARRTRSIIECDVHACSTALGQTAQGTALELLVLRCAELLAPDVGSELFDYLCAPICLRPLGFDPILNVISIADASRALASAALGNALGVFNIPGRDTLALSRLIALSDRPALPIPAPWLTPLYVLRAQVTSAEFRYPGHAARFHHSGILNGARAARELDYRPEQALDFEHLADQVRTRIRRIPWPRFRER